MVMLFCKFVGVALTPPRQRSAEAATVQMVERSGDGGERIAGVDHGLDS